MVKMDAGRAGCSRARFDYINNDKRGAAQTYFDSIGGKGETIEEIMATLNDPKNVITMTPQNTLRYAQFMHEIGSLKNRANSWKDLFFRYESELEENRVDRRFLRDCGCARRICGGAVPKLSRQAHARDRAFSSRRQRGSHRQLSRRILGSPVKRIE